MSNWQQSRFLTLCLARVRVLGLLVLVVAFESGVSSVGSFAQSQAAQLSQYLTSASDAYERQDWKKAVTNYNAALKLDPGDADAFARLGIAYQGMGMLDPAADALKNALRLKPDLPDVGILLAFIEVKQGHYPEAVPLLKKGLDDPNSDAPLRLRAGERLVDLCFSLGREGDALQSLQKLKKLAPDDPDVLYTASQAYSALWKNTVEQLYSKDPNSYQAHQVLASAAEAKENFEEAAKEYRIVIQMQPRLPGVHYRLGMAILRQGATPDRKQEAITEFRKELDVDPDDAATHVQLGELALDLHQPKEAEEHFTRAVYLQPSDARARVDLGKLLVGKRDFDGAAKQLQAAVRSAPADETAYYQLMLAYRGLGRIDEAKAALAIFEKLRREKAQQEAKTLKDLQAPLAGEGERGASVNPNPNP